jgi:transcriptional regulator with XRE-family HTH domain
MKAAAQSSKSNLKQAATSERAGSENSALPNELTIALGKSIAKLREKKGFTQDELAAKAEIERSRVNKIENGRVNCSVLTLATLAYCLEVRMSDLFKGIKHTHPPTSEGGVPRRTNQASLFNKSRVKLRATKTVRV